jgi:NAD(P)H dehydrogenase (quinone)
MHVYIIFAHPSEDSFNHDILEMYIKGLREAGHTYEIGDLYRMDFESDMNLAQYQREVGLDPGAPVPDDVRPSRLRSTRPTFWHSFTRCGGAIVRPG